MADRWLRTVLGLRNRSRAIVGTRSPRNRRRTISTRRGALEGDAPELVLEAGRARLGGLGVALGVEHPHGHLETGRVVVAQRAHLAAHRHPIGGRQRTRK